MNPKIRTNIITFLLSFVQYVETTRHLLLTLFNGAKFLMQNTYYHYFSNLLNDQGNLTEK